MIESFASPEQLGTRNVRDILTGPVIVQEKIDGSQFSFALGTDGEVECRSKGQMIEGNGAQFSLAVATVKALKSELIAGWVYRGEAVTKPRHNVLCYDRIPKGGVILFGVERFTGPMLGADLTLEAARLGLESVPILFEGMTDIIALKALLETKSVLGGCTIEGVVIKRGAMAAKLVSDAFKETAGTLPKIPSAQKADIVEVLTTRYRCIPRWQKAVQHLRDDGKLTGTPRDIGPLVTEMTADVEKECADEIKQYLYDHFMPQIKRGLPDGLALWYKEQLLAPTPTDTPPE